MGAKAKQFYFKLARVVAYIVCHIVVLTRKIISVNIDGSKMVDIVS